MENSLLTNISSHYIIRQTFSHLEFHRFFSLIKYNKLLQNKMQINLKKLIHSNKFFERYEKNELTDDRRNGFNFLCGCIVFCVHYFYFILHYLINVPIFIRLNPNLYKTEDHYWTILTNLIFKLLSLFFHMFSAYVLYHILSHFSNEYLYRKIIFIILTLFIIYAYCWYEIGLVHKIKLTYKFAINGKWMVLVDSLCLIANTTFIFFVIRFLCLYLGSKTFPRYMTAYVLVLYKDIKIKEYKFKEDFKYIDNKRKKIDSEAIGFRTIYSEEDSELVRSINYYRLKHNLSELICDKTVPDFIRKGYSEIFLSANNIVKLSNIKNVLIFNNEVDFESLKENKEIMNIIMQPFFNVINIVQQGDTKYITVYEDIYEKNYHKINIKEENENTILKTNLIN